MKYRPEIDGLRAVAVIPVIFFHAGFTKFSGGFVGVDVFFVISGYLITTIILSEKEQNIFSLVNFYERRARRILPALFFVMVVSLPLAWLLLLPSDMMNFSQSLIAVSSFSSNILFWLETGYWGSANELKPLLHTWSLAVEEQYYIIFPLFLISMWHFRKRWILSSFMVIAAISLTSSQWAAYNAPRANFFLLHTRAWELAIGACIAFFFLYRKSVIIALQSHRPIGEAASLGGFLMVWYAVFVFDETVPFPSFYTLLPTLGTGLIILFSSAKTTVGRLLGTKLFVGIGLISYSTYLWHQILIAFTRHASLFEPSELSLAAITTLSFPLAYLSWRFIERPFRKKGRISRRVIFTFSIFGSVVFIAIGIAGITTDGFDGRLTKNKSTLKFIEQKLEPNYGLQTCSGVPAFSPDCRTSDEPEILIWGDSFAMQLVQGIVASSPNPKIIQMTKSVCGPIFDIAPVTPRFPVSWAKGCLEFNGEVRNWIKANNTVKYAVLSSPFKQYLSKDNKLLSRNGNLSDPSIDTVTEAFTKTLNELESMGVVPIVFSPPPVNGKNLGRCLAKAEWKGINLDECNFNLNQMSQTTKEVYSFLDNFKSRYRVIRLDNLICDSFQCKAHLGSIWLFGFSEHLSPGGSAALGIKYGFYKRITNSNSNSITSH